MPGDTATNEITVALDDARVVMYDELVEMAGEQLIQETIQRDLAAILTELYDNRHEIAAKAEAEAEAEAQSE
jgi:hypothetical protein